MRDVTRDAETGDESLQVRVVEIKHCKQGTVRRQYPSWPRLPGQRQSTTLLKSETCRLVIAGDDGAQPDVSYRTLTMFDLECSEVNIDTYYCKGCMSALAKAGKKKGENRTAHYSPYRVSSSGYRTSKTRNQSPCSTSCREKENLRLSQMCWATDTQPLPQ